MLLNIRHETLYRYERPVRYSIQYLRLTPRADALQRVLQWRVDAPGRIWRQEDAYGNVVHVVSCEQPHHELRIAVHGAVETSLSPGTPLAHDLPLPPAAFLVPTRLTESNDALQRLSAHAFAPERSPKEAIEELMSSIRNEVIYEQGSTDVDHTAAQALALRRGVCQDLAHIFLTCARLGGHPARYVSGYFESGDPGDVASHAWVDIWLEGEGWISYDPTNAVATGARYCRLAIGRDYLDASPVRGARRGGTSERLEVVVQVEPGSTQQ